MPPKLEYFFYMSFRFILGGIFIWASVDKILDPAGFAEVVKNYRILPEIFVNPFALILPWVELLCGAALLTGYMIEGGAITIDLLIIMFIVSISVNMIRGVDISCGCFSNSLSIKKNMAWYLFRDVIYLFLGIWIIIFRIKNENMSRLNAF